MLDEIKEQMKDSGQPVWITYIGERLDMLADRSLAIPIMEEVNKLREKVFNDLEKKQKK